MGSAGLVGLGFIGELLWGVEGWRGRGYNFSGKWLIVDLSQGGFELDHDGAAIRTGDGGVYFFDLGGHACGELLEPEGEVECANDGVEAGEAVGMAPAVFEVVGE